MRQHHGSSMIRQERAVPHDLAGMGALSWFMNYRRGMIAISNNNRIGSKFGACYLEEGVVLFRRGCGDEDTFPTRRQLEALRLSLSCWSKNLSHNTST